MTYPYTVKIDGVFYQANTEIASKTIPVVEETVETDIFDGMTIKELRAYAKEHEITLGRDVTAKSDIIEFLRANA